MKIQDPSLGTQRRWSVSYRRQREACRAQERGWEENRGESRGFPHKGKCGSVSVLFLTQMCRIATISLSLSSAVVLTQDLSEIVPTHILIQGAGRPTGVHCGCCSQPAGILTIPPHRKVNLGGSALWWGCCPSLPSETVFSGVSFCELSMQWV